MASGHTLLLVAKFAQAYLNALEVRSHGPLRIGRFLIASIHPRRARLPAAAVSGVGDRYSERSLGVDHLSSRRGGGARCSTPPGVSSSPNRSGVSRSSHPAEAGSRPAAARTEPSACSVSRYMP